MGIHLRSFCVPLLCITFKRQRHKENFTILTPWTKFNEQSSERAFPSLEEYETIFFKVKLSVIYLTISNVNGWREVEQFLLRTKKLSNCLIIFLKTNSSFPAGIYLLKVNNKNTSTRCQICSKFTIETPECI